MKFFPVFILTLLILPTLTSAQDNFLVGIPGVGNPSGDFDGYLQAVYAMFISIAALLAVVKIVIAGLKYMLTDIAPQKTSAKSDIQGALLGLLIVMSAVLILTVINPELTRFDFDANRVAAPDAPPLDLSTETLTETSLECPEGEDAVVSAGVTSCQPTGDIEDLITVDSPDDDVVFIFTPINNSTFLAAAQTVPYLSNFSLSQIEGVVIVPKTITNGSNYEFDVLRPSCGEAVGNEEFELIEVPRGVVEDPMWFCINVND